MQSKFNEDQKNALSSKKQFNFVLAGPGTGKTTTLVGRLRHLLSNGVSPKEIICVTFNKKAADEILQRVKRSIEIDSKLLQIGTFHSLANRIISKDLSNITPIEEDYEIWASDFERMKKIKEFVKQAVKVGYYGKKIILKNIDITEVLRFVDDARDTLTDPENAMIIAEESGNPFAEGHAWVYDQFNRFLKENKKVDFPRMIELAVSTLKSTSSDVERFTNKFNHILIDEYQDINLSQKVLVDLLLHSKTNLWVVGDDDQAIYGWRGSNVSFLLNFERNYPGSQKFFLKTNYRSGDLIIKASSRLASHLSQRFPKQFTGSRGVKGEIRFRHSLNDEQENAYLIKMVMKLLKEKNEFKDIAILSRINDLANPVASNLVSLGVPVILKGGVGVFSNYQVQLMLSSLAISSSIKQEKLWRHKVGSELFSFSKKLENDNWDKKVKSISTFIINRLPENRSDDELLDIVEEIEEAKSILLKTSDANTFFSNLKKTIQEPKDGNGIFLGTIHSAKGLEWKNVFIMGFEDDMLPYYRSYTPKEVEEERRLTYVAMTRAKDKLILSAVKYRMDNPSTVSRFFDELGLTKKEKIFNPTEISKEIPNKTEWSPPKDPLSERFLGRKEFLPDQEIAKGDGETSSGWSDLTVGTGLLTEAGYTVRKEGPIRAEREDILRNVLTGNVSLPDWITDSVKSQWSDPNSSERLQKIRNTLNIALGNQKGRKNPSTQAIEKWTSDIKFIDTVLFEEINNDQ